MRTLRVLSFLAAPALAAAWMSGAVPPDEPPGSGGVTGRVDCVWSPTGGCGYPTMACVMKGGLCSALPHAGYEMVDGNHDGCSCALSIEE